MTTTCNNLSAAALVAGAQNTLYSPSCNACLVRVENKRIRNDPYRASVIAASPSKKTSAAAASTCLPPVAATKRNSLTDVFGFKAPASVVKPVMMSASTAAEVVAARPQFTASLTSSDESVNTDIMTQEDVAEEQQRTAAATTTFQQQNNFTAPAASATSSFPTLSNERYVVVEFKHELCTYQAPFRVTEGDLVVVEADRGEHAGVVKHVLNEKPHFNVPCRILRHGTARDEEAIQSARPKEDVVTSQIQKMSDNLGLGIRIVDTEFYSDNNKLTVFFASKTQVDFRKLQRSLFREYRCRIWLINYAEVQYRNKHFRNRK